MIILLQSRMSSCAFLRTALTNQQAAPLWQKISVINLKKKKSKLHSNKRSTLLTFFTMPVDCHQITMCCRWLFWSTSIYRLPFGIRGLRDTSLVVLSFFWSTKLKRGVLSLKWTAGASPYFFIFQKRWTEVNSELQNIHSSKCWSQSTEGQVGSCVDQKKKLQSVYYLGRKWHTTGPPSS